MGMLVFVYMLLSNVYDDVYCNVCSKCNVPVRPASARAYVNFQHSEPAESHTAWSEKMRTLPSQ